MCGNGNGNGHNRACLPFLSFVCYVVFIFKNEKASGPVNSEKIVKGLVELD